MFYKKSWKLTFFIFSFIASCTEAAKKDGEGLITSELSLTYVNLDNHTYLDNYLIIDVRYINRSKQALFFYYPRVLVDTLNQGIGNALINDGFLNMEAVKNDTLVNKDVRDLILKTFENPDVERSKSFENSFRKNNKDAHKFRNRMFERFIFLKPGEQRVKSFFFQNIFSIKDHLLPTDTLVFKSDNWLGTARNNVTAKDASSSSFEEDLFHSLPKMFNGYVFYNHKIISDSLTIVRKGFNPVRFLDIEL